MASSPDLAALLTRAESVLARLEAWLPPPPPATDWSAHAWRWRVGAGGRGGLEAVHKPHGLALDALTGVDEQKTRLVRNTRQFIAGRPANNVLLTGARGTGKSSLVKALLPAFAADGLRLIEVDKTHLADLADIVELLAERPERFIIYCDDLSFEEGDDAYKALKTALDGGLARRADNVLIYATSNRRHLMPEYFSENLETRTVNDEIRPGETTEEKVSLSDRFGLWISFYPFSQDDYLAVFQHWARELGVAEAVIAGSEREALNWALGRGSRSGRTAWQYAKELAGQQKPARKKAK